MVDGCENRIAEAIAATVAVLRIFVDTDIGVADVCSNDARIVMTATMPPASKVVLTSPVEQVSGDVIERLMLPEKCLDRGADM